MTDPLEERFYACPGGVRLGPFTQSELAELFAGGALTADTPLVGEHSGQATTTAVLLETAAAATLPSLRDSAAHTASEATEPYVPPPPRPEIASAISTIYRVPAANEPTRAAFVLGPGERGPVAKILAKWGFSFLIAVGALCFLASTGNWVGLHWNLLKYVDLITHEAGHEIFIFGGEMLSFLGGTILQLFFPVFLAVFFLCRREMRGSQFCLFWLGESLIDVGVYLSDARTQQLDLLGGTIHDWHHILGRMGLLAYDHLLSEMVFCLAALAFIAAILLPLFNLKSKAQPTNPRNPNPVLTL